MKSSVLLYFENKDTKAIVQLLLESKFSVKVFEATSESNAADVLRKNPTVTLFICDNNLSNEKIWANLLSIASEINTIICTNDYPENKKSMVGQRNFHYIVETSWVEHLTDTISRFLSFKDSLPFQNASVELWESEFCRIRSSLLPKVAPLNTDIFIKLSEKKLLKIFQIGDVFDLEDLDRYMNQKKVQYFFVHKVDSNVFLKRLSIHIERLVKIADIKTPISKSSIFQTAH